jgi:DNA-directed RNA polymerase subunit H (RpoH/RPB5)
MNHALISSYLRARLVQLEMVNDRGYSLNDSEINQRDQLRIWLKDQSKLPNFYVAQNLNREQFPSWLDRQYSKLTSNGQDTLNVYYLHNIDRLTYVEGDITKNIDSLTNVIIIVPQPLKSGKLKSLSGIEGVHIMIFTLDELQMNITQHFYQPKFRRLSPDERANWLRRNGIATIKLPMMTYVSIKNTNKALLNSDPVVKYYDYRPEDIIEVETEIFQVPIPIRTNITYCRVHGN